MDLIDVGIKGRAVRRRAQAFVVQLFLLPILLLISPYNALAADAGTASVTVAWDPSPSEGIAGYVVYVGTESHQYTRSIPTSGTSCVITNLTRGVTYYIAVTAVDSTGLESDFSEELIYTPPLNAGPQVTLSLGQSGTLSLKGTGIASARYNVLASQDMLIWTNLGTISADSQGSISFTDSKTAGLSKQFYRLVQVP